ncbi:hypothetical protein EYZ11_005167 [Aspergillus tanneri]|uniref:Uncharacterized protein n=1 Tax=Aspergillus tanneri TaxID=1220188 RepID=A0A4S3JIT4_9EURO|nr:hypothetical protein EYZ11_005167 [Aspergillus tanneri]
MAKAGALGEIEGIEVLELEVTSDESIGQCAKAVEKHTGGSLDILVNNAGVSTVMPLLDASIDDAKKLYDTNVWAILAMAQAFAPMLIKAKGVLCNISSVSGEMVFAWAETLRLEMAPLGVRVVTVILGGVQTSGNDPANIEDLELPENSYYRKISAVIDRHKKVLVHPNKQDVDVAAKNLVNDVLSADSVFIRRGAASTLSWFCNTFLPYGLFNSIINRDSGLAEIGLRKDTA